MRSTHYALAAALVFGLARAATAQTTSTATTQPTSYGETESHWVASGFVGSGFDTELDISNGDNFNLNNGGGVAYGGQVGFLWRGIVGPEFLAEWAPAFDVGSAFIPDNGHTSSYMANAIGAIPLGANGRIQPFISGGVGTIQMHADVMNGNQATVSASDSQWGTNIGGGIMAFANDRVGLRGDVRHYRAFTDQNFDGPAADEMIHDLVSGLGYWRATGGVSFRW